MTTTKGSGSRRGGPAHYEERRFGRTVGLVLVVVGAWLGIWRGHTWAGGPVGALGFVLIALGTVAPARLATANRLWMSLALALGTVSTKVILTVLYLFMLTPIGWMLRARRWDPLSRRSAAGETYWVPYPERHRDPKHYEKMF